MFGFRKNKVSVQACFAGERVAIEDVPDGVFSQRMLGDGFAIRPFADASSVDVLAPISGTVKQLFATKHAFVISSEALSVLVHIGLDTVELNGDGLTGLVEVGQEVQQGDAIVRLDVARVRELGKDPVTPVIFPDAAQVETIKVVTAPIVAADTKVCEVTLTR